MTQPSIPLWQRRIHAALAIEPHELRGCLWSTLFHFLILTALFLARPVREALGIAQGAQAIPWLYTGTFVTTLLLTPLFGKACARLHKPALVSAVYHVFALLLVLACVLLSLNEGQVRLWVGYAFYIGFSACNLFTTAVFWAVMVDHWQTHQGKRLFGCIAAGGTLGTIFGSWIVQLVAPAWGVGAVLLLAAAAIEVGSWCGRRVLATGTATDTHRPQPVASWRDAFAGARVVWHSPYLRAIAIYLAIDTMAATFLYYQQGATVALAAPTTEERTRIFGLINLLQNVLTVAIELLLTARVLRWLNVGPTLTIEPLICLLSFAGLGVLTWLGLMRDPTLALIALGTCQVLQRTSKYSFTRPAREVLFTAVPAEQKYRAKAFIDTAVYRGSDMAWAWLALLLETLTRSLGTLALVGAPIAAAWAWFGNRLGRRTPDRSLDSSADTTAAGK